MTEASSSAATAQASGPFDVKITPQPTWEGVADLAIGRMSIDKQYHGDLEAFGKGEMLTAGTEVKGSAAYVAIERVSGTLHGRAGTFALHHRGIMTRGDGQLAISIVPDSGTGELAGVTGEMTITIANGKHSYALEYRLTEDP